VTALNGILPYFDVAPSNVRIEALVGVEIRELAAFDAKDANIHSVHRF
jgi:hypothetical protein